MTFKSLAAMQRRDFLKLAGVAALAGAADPSWAASSGSVAVLLDPSSSVTSSGPVRRAAQRLCDSLAARGQKSALLSAPEQARRADFVIAAAPFGAHLTTHFHFPEPDPATPESLRLVPGAFDRTPALLLAANDPRGFIYGLLELAERVQYASSPMAALRLALPVQEQPANPVRSVGRYFCSEVEDKPWYESRDFWRGYLDLLVASRFNRFNLGFGLGYDFPRGVTGDYFHFAYPYLVEVPAYPNVRVLQLATADGKRLSTPVPLSSGERARNFEMLRFIAAETGARGLEFQLGIWTHAYQWTDSPNAYHRIEGLTPETHAAYCRDALAIILKECPEIQGLTLRVHGESGIPEGSYDFWRTLFGAISGCGRKVEIDMHAKGVNQTMIDMAADTGMPVKLGAKYSAEHQSLGYQQADIRALEIPKPNHEAGGPFSVSGGPRLFTRYGYADFLERGTRFQLLFRLWPGTQRHLLSCDPEMAAAYGRTSHFCGAVGLDICEPLTFKGREGSGLPGGRCAYSDASLNPAEDWQKFEPFYRVWGRKLYDPDAEAEVWQRRMRADFGPAAPSLESALAHASRVLPLLTSAHLPSASNHSFWAEMDQNMPIVLGSEPSPYGDTPVPKCFGTVSPLDPQLFSTIVEHASDLLAGRANPKYSPIEVAQWLEDFTAASESALQSARVQASSPGSPAFRRVEEDVLIQNGLGRFFANKLRAGVLYEIAQQSGNADAGQQALAHYRRARNAWAAMASRAERVYRFDITYGDVPIRRGHWSNRLPGIDKDIAALEEKLQSNPAAASTAQDTEAAIHAATGKPRRPAVPLDHNPPAGFAPGQPLHLRLALARPSADEDPTQIRLFYRHVDQAERWRSMDMTRKGREFTAALPAGYSQSRFPLQYYFELRSSSSAWLYPAFNAALSNQPYYAVMPRA